MKKKNQNQKRYIGSYCRNLVLLLSAEYLQKKKKKKNSSVNRKGDLNHFKSLYMT